MSNSGKSPSSDKRNRPARVSPRRHVDEVVSSTGTYDGAEFPVLLRMPDLSKPIPTPAESVKPPMTEDRNPIERPAVAEVVQPPVERRSRHKPTSGSSESWKRTSSEKRPTGNAAARFWSTIPPQIAAGGMLLAVITLCFVLLRDSKTPTPALPATSDWQHQAATSTDKKLVDAPGSQQNASQHSTEEIAAEGSPRIEVATRRENSGTFKPVDVKPEVPAGQSSSKVSGWPQSGADDAGPVEEDSQPVQGWPDIDSGDSATGGATKLTGPLDSKASPESPTHRTAQRPSRPQSTTSEPDVGSTDFPRLDGTVEIPPPTKIYRQ